jgi:hypothetical protein
MEDLMRPQQRASSLTMRRAGDGYSANTVLETFQSRNVGPSLPSHALPVYACRVDCFPLN